MITKLSHRLGINKNICLFVNGYNIRDQIVLIFIFLSKKTKKKSVNIYINYIMIND